MKFYLRTFFALFILISETKGQETPLLIKAKYFALVFPNWKLDRNYFEIEQTADSTFFYPELGETPEGMVFKITENVKFIKITQHYRTTLSISEEGPHWDLFDWKHYISPKLPINQNEGYFGILKCSDEQKNRFPDYKEKELTGYVKIHSPQMMSLLYKKEKFTKEALYHSISEIYLTISYIKPDTTQVLKHVIVFNLPLGC